MRKDWQDSSDAPMPIIISHGLHRRIVHGTGVDSMMIAFERRTIALNIRKLIATDAMHTNKKLKDLNKIFDDELSQ